MRHLANAMLFVMAIWAAIACRGPEAREAVIKPQPPVLTSGQSEAGEHISLESPYRPRAHTYRGQLHAHTTNSDGHQPPKEFVTAYKNAGYDFMAITDHDHATPDPGVPGILFLHGMENEDGCHHENRINRHAVAAGAPHPQLLVDEANGEGSFVQINHPDWPGKYPSNPCWSDKDLLAMHGYDAVEVWNASDISDGDPNAETRIDFLLSHGKRTYLTAVDDCHDVRYSYCLTSSVMVSADALTQDDILANLKSGNFYATRGALILSISVSDRRISASLPRSCDVEYVVAGGKVAMTEHAVTASHYDADGTERYVRLRISCGGDTMAWSNPIYVSVR